MTANKLLVDFINRTFTFQGNGLFKSGADSFSGDEIVVLDEGKRIKVSNAKGSMIPKSSLKPLRKPRID